MGNTLVNPLEIECSHIHNYSCFGGQDEIYDECCEYSSSKYLDRYCIYHGRDVEQQHCPYCDIVEVDKSYTALPNLDGDLKIGTANIILERQYETSIKITTEFTHCIYNCIKCEKKIHINVSNLTDYEYINFPYESQYCYDCFLQEQMIIQSYIEPAITMYRNFNLTCVVEDNKVEIGDRSVDIYSISSGDVCN